MFESIAFKNLRKNMTCLIPTFLDIAFKTHKVNKILSKQILICECVLVKSCQFWVREVSLYHFPGLPFIHEQEHKVSYRCSLPSPLQKRFKDYKGLGGSASFELLSFLRLYQKVSQLSEKLFAKVNENSEA